MTVTIDCAECGRAWTEADERLGLCVACPECRRLYCVECMDHDCEPSQYVMDDATWDHLVAWMRNEAGYGRDVLESADLVATFLQRLDVAEAEYYLSRPWGVAYAEAQAWAERIARRQSLESLAELA